MKDPEKTFHWIIGILEKADIKYKISGGLAAQAYGVHRELADIDIEVADKDIKLIQEIVKPYIIFGPERYTDKDWDLNLMTLNHRGQEIDIAGTNAQIFDKESQSWENCPGDLETVEMKEIFGKIVPTESRDSLIAYKTKLARPVDIEDIRQLTN